MDINNGNTRLMTGRTGPHDFRRYEGYGRNACDIFARYNEYQKQLIEENNKSFRQYMEAYKTIGNSNDPNFKKNIEKLQKLGEKDKCISEKLTKSFLENYEIQYSSPQNSNPDDSLKFVDEKGKIHETSVKTNSLLGFAAEDIKIAKENGQLPASLGSTLQEELATDAATELFEDMMSNDPNKALKTGQLELPKGRITKDGANIAIRYLMKNPEQSKKILGQIRKEFGLDEKAKEFINKYKYKENLKKEKNKIII